MFMLPMAQYQPPYLDLGENINSLLNVAFTFCPPKPEIKEINVAL